MNGVGEVLAVLVALAVIPAWLRMLRRGLGEPLARQAPARPAAPEPASLPASRPARAIEGGPSVTARARDLDRGRPAPYRLAVGGPVRKSVSGNRRAIEGGDRG